MDTIKLSQVQATIADLQGFLDLKVLRAIADVDMGWLGHMATSHLITTSPCESELVTGSASRRL